MVGLVEVGCPYLFFLNSVVALGSGMTGVLSRESDPFVFLVVDLILVSGATCSVSEPGHFSAVRPLTESTVMYFTGSTSTLYV